MLDLQEKEKKCTACGACMNICPVDAITFSYKKDGLFLYPFVDEDKCIRCGKCDRICPIGRKVVVERYREPIVYAAAANYEERKESSSGAIFPLLARIIINRGGCVVGAEFATDWKLYLTIGSNEESINRYRQSKYVNATPTNIYRDVKRLLDEGTFILFTGTPCQISGLYAFLQKDYDNLYTMDFICHGTPSDRLFRDYLDAVSNGKTINKISFRNKKYGWDNHNLYLELIYDDSTSYVCGGGKDSYFSAFLDARLNRLSCGSCADTGIPRAGDITVGDCWGIQQYEPEIYDGRGLSWVSINSEKGRLLYSEIETDLQINVIYPLEELLNRNMCYSKPKELNINRERSLDLAKRKGVKRALEYTSEKNKYDVVLAGNPFGENYGSMLSVWCLYKILQEMGKEVLVAPIIGNIPKSGSIVDEFVSSMYPNFDVYFKEPYYQNLRKLNEYADTFVLASEQYWKSLVSEDIDDGRRLLSFVDDNKHKVAIAVSQNEKWWGQTIPDKEEKRFWLTRFDSISVREEESKQEMIDLFGVTPEVLLDPVLILGKEQIVERFRISSTENNLICAYLLEPNMLKDAVVKEISAELCCAFDIVTYGENNVLRTRGSHYKVESKLVVQQWIEKMARSSFIVTDSYHGLCLALLFHKNFIVIPHENRGTRKVYSLLDLVEIRQRVWDGEENMSTFLTRLSEVDWNNVDNILDNERKRALDWIANAISVKEAKDITEFDIVRKMLDQDKELMESDEIFFLNKYLDKIKQIIRRIFK